MNKVPNALGLISIPCTLPADKCAFLLDIIHDRDTNGTTAKDPQA